MPLDGSFKYADRVLKARGPVDGDGDGFVYDGTPRKRPATPAERAAGARLRAQQGKGGAQAPAAAKKAPAKKAPAAKKAAAKNDYDKRVDKFDRAINQAIRSKDPKQVKEVQRLIEQDFILKKPDRDDLVAVLNARRDGLPDPAPVKGSNRAARGVQGGQPPAKKAAAPAKKAPAKKPAPKEERKPPQQAAEPKEKTPEPPKKATEAPKFDMPGSMQIGQAYEDKIKQAKTRREVDNIQREFEANPRLRDVHKRALRRDAEKRRQEIAPKKTGPVTRAHRALSEARRNGEAGMAARTPLSPDPAPAAPTRGSDTSHGAKTKAWKRLVQRDIGKAKTDREFAALKTQVNNLRRDKRISGAEHRDLMQKIGDREMEVRRIQQQGRQSSIRRRMASVRRRVQRPATPDPRKDAEARAAKIERDIAAATDLTDLRAIQRRLQGGEGIQDRRALAAQRDLLERVNDKFKARVESLRNKPQTPPKDDKSRRVREVEEHLENAAKQRGRIARERHVQRALDAINADSGLGQETRMELIDRAEAIYRGRPDPGRKKRRDPVRPANTPPAKKTVQPPSQPGAARAAARAGGAPRANPRVRSYLQRIDAAGDTADLQAIANDLGEGKGNLNAQEVDEVFDALDRKHRRLEPLADNRAARILGRPPRDKKIPKYQGNVDESPAGRFLAGGGNIEDVPDPDGLFDYIEKHPERFEVKKISNGQVSECRTVIDKSNGRKYFFKATDNNGPAEMWGDGVNEYMAAHLGNAAFPGVFPQVDWAGRPEGNANARIRMEHMDEMAKRFGASGNDVQYNGDNADGDRVKDPKNVLAVHMFDYLINQTDRHAGNFGVINGRGGQVIVPLDNGAAFHGYDGYVNAHQPGGVMGRLAREPENVDYVEWAGIGKTRSMRALASRAYSAKGWGRDKAYRDAADILDQFRDVDIDKIIADLRERFPNLNDYEDDHLEGVALIWKTRLQRLNPNDVVRMLSL